MNPDIYKKAFLFLMHHAPILYFRIDVHGRILDLNKFAEDIAGPKKADTRLQGLIIDFKADFRPTDLAEKKATNKLLSIATVTGEPTSFYFTFIKHEDDILVFGYKDVAEMEFMRRQVLDLNQDLVNTTRLLHQKNAQLQDALDHVKTLQGIIPICAHCNKIRNDDQVWERIDVYLSENTDARLSHGICNDCLKKHYPE